MQSCTKIPLKTFKKIPIYVVEEHNDALQFIYGAIGAKKLPLEGTTLVHLDSHPDMLISRHLTGDQARSGKKLLPLLDIENWIVPATASGYLSKVVWLRPPWAKQLADGTRVVSVGDNKEGLFRVGSKEPYFLSDALYCSELENERAFALIVAELGDPNNENKTESDCINSLVNNFNLTSPYVLDIDLDFFSTDNPFLHIHDDIGLYDKLEKIFTFTLPSNFDDTENVKEVVEARDKQLDELEKLFQYLQEHGSFEHWKGEKTELFSKVKELTSLLLQESEKTGIPIDWWLVYAAGCTRDQGGLPVHRSTEEQILNLVQKSLRNLLAALPSPVLVTISRSTDDGYCPADKVDFIQDLVLKELRDAFDTATPELCYIEIQD